MTQKKILGVCAWLADKFELDVSMVRLVFILTTLLGGASIIVLG